MANVKISDLTAVTTPASTDEFEINQGGTSFKATRAQVHSLEAGETFNLSAAAGITASTTQTQGQGALTNMVNEVATVATTNDTVTLPSAVAGRVCAIDNNGANTLQIFPASGDDLGAGVDTATTLATTVKALFIAYDATTWSQFI